MVLLEKMAALTVLLYVDTHSLLSATAVCGIAGQRQAARNEVHGTMHIQIASEVLHFTAEQPLERDAHHRFAQQRIGVIAACIFL